MGELVLHDSAGEFLLVHGTDDYLSLARAADAQGEVPLVRFAPPRAPVLAAAMEAVLGQPEAGALSVSAGSDVLRVEAVTHGHSRAIRVANLSRWRPGTVEPEALELDRRVALATVDALRGQALAPLCPPRPTAFMDDGQGRAAGVESHEGNTVVSARDARVWARARFACSLRRVVAGALATVMGNPGESAIRVAHVERGGDQVLIERLATAAGPFAYAVANARPGRPARPRRTVRLTEEMASFVVHSLARDTDPRGLPRPTTRPGDASDTMEPWKSPSVEGPGPSVPP